MAIYSLHHSSIGRSTHSPGTAGAHIGYITRSSACDLVMAARMPAARPGQRGGEARAWVDQVESTDRKNGRVIDKIMVALPLELDLDQLGNLVRGFAEEVTQGLASWLAAFHDLKSENPHVHLVIRDRDPVTGKRVIGLSEIGSTERLRRAWELVANAALAQAGKESRIDRRTLKAQGIDRQPQIHVGPKAKAIIKKARGAAAAGWKPIATVPASKPRTVRTLRSERVVDYTRIDQRGRVRYSRQGWNQRIINNNNQRGPRQRERSRPQPPPSAPALVLPASPALSVPLSPVPVQPSMVPAAPAILIAPPSSKPQSIPVLVQPPPLRPRPAPARSAPKPADDQPPPSPGIWGRLASLANGAVEGWQAARRREAEKRAAAEVALLAVEAARQVRIEREQREVDEEMARGDWRKPIFRSPLGNAAPAPAPASSDEPKASPEPSRPHVEPSSPASKVIAPDVPVAAAQPFYVLSGRDAARAAVDQAYAMSPEERLARLAVNRALLLKATDPDLRAELARGVQVIRGVQQRETDAAPDETHAKSTKSRLDRGHGM